jgi:quercetin dioxygenase-like cupin family protein
MTKDQSPLHAYDVHATSAAKVAPLPPDDAARQLAFVPADERQQVHLALLGGATHTILLGGADTAGRFILLHTFMPPNGGPPPHRHDFEEAFTVLEGELEVTFRGQTRTVQAGETINIPANAPHAVNNTGGRPARFLCVCAPAGLDEFFRSVGVAVPTQTSVAPTPSEDEQAAYRAKFAQYAPLARTEML